MSQAWLLASGKGGTGKSLTTAALGCALADSGYSVCLIDGSFGQRGLDFPLGLQCDAFFDVEDVLAGRCSLREALVSPKGIRRLSLLTAPQKQETEYVTPERLQLLVKELKRIAAYVLIDLPGGWNECNLLWSKAADGCLVVTTPDEACIRSCDQQSRYLREKEVRNQLLLINQVHENWVNKGLCPTPQMIANTLDLPLLGYMPFDTGLQKHLLRKSYPSVSKGPYFKAIYRVCGRLLGEDVAMPSLKARYQPRREP